MAGLVWDSTIRFLGDELLVIRLPVLQRRPVDLVRGLGLQAPGAGADDCRSQSRPQPRRASEMLSCPFRSVRFCVATSINTYETVQFRPATSPIADSDAPAGSELARQPSSVPAVLSTGLEYKQLVDELPGGRRTTRCRRRETLALAADDTRVPQSVWPARPLSPQPEGRAADPPSSQSPHAPPTSHSAHAVRPIQRAPSNPGSADRAP